MWPELDYDRMVTLERIDYLIGVVESYIHHVEPSDSYFRQLSTEKFALQQLRHEIGEHNDEDFLEVIYRFARRMDSSMNENKHPDLEYIFSISRDTAQSILDNIYFG